MPPDWTNYVNNKHPSSNKPVHINKSVGTELTHNARTWDLDSSNIFRECITSLNGSTHRSCATTALTRVSLLAMRVTVAAPNE